MKDANAWNSLYLASATPPRPNPSPSAAGGISTKRELSALQKLGMDAAVGMALYKNRLA